jgi:hypothetical protein
MGSITAELNEAFDAGITGKIREGKELCYA